MKKYLSILALCLVASPAIGFEINAGVTGSWFNPARNGHGFAIEYTEQPGACEQINGQGCLVVYWFVYDKEGNPIFLLGQLPVDGNIAEGELRYFSDMEFGSFTPVPIAQSWGTLRLRFSDCESGFANYDANFAPQEGEPFDGDGNFKIQRLAFAGNLDCSRAGRIATLPKSAIGGVWLGTAISTDFTGGQTRSLIMVADEDNNAWIFGSSPELFFQGSLLGDGANVSGTLDAKAVLPEDLFNGNQTGQVDFEMSGRPGDFLEGTFEGTGVSADFELGYQQESQRPASPARLARCWGAFGTFSGYSANAFKISDSGEFSITLNNDCKLDASAQPAGESWGLYDANATLSNCDEYNGEYAGVLVMIDAGVPGDDGGLLIALEGENASFAGQATLLKPDQCQ